MFSFALQIIINLPSDWQNSVVASRGPAHNSPPSSACSSSQHTFPGGTGTGGGVSGKKSKNQSKRLRNRSLETVLDTVSSPKSESYNTTSGYSSASKSKTTTGQSNMWSTSAWVTYKGHREVAQIVLNLIWPKISTSFELLTDPHFWWCEVADYNSK